jgi:hypothetical protein
MLAFPWKIVIKSLYIYLFTLIARFPYSAHRYTRVTMYGSHNKGEAGEETMKRIWILALAAIGALLLIEAPSWGKLDVANCGTRHAATRCHVAHHNNPYGMAGRGNIYGRTDTTVYSPGVSNSRFYYGTDPDPRIVFELRRDPSYARASSSGARAG